MEVLDSHLDPQDPQFQANATHNRELAEELRNRLAQARSGGGEQEGEGDGDQTVHFGDSSNGLMEDQRFSMKLASGLPSSSAPTSSHQRVVNRRSTAAGFTPRSRAFEVRMPLSTNQVATRSTSCG